MLLSRICINRDICVNKLRPSRSTRTDSLFTYTMRFRSVANDTDNNGFRRHNLIEPTSNWSALLSRTFIHSGGVGSQPELRTPFPGSTTGQNIAGPPIPGTKNYLVGGAPLVNEMGRA